MERRISKVFGIVALVLGIFLLMGSLGVSGYAVLGETGKGLSGSVFGIVLFVIGVWFLRKP